MDVRNLILKKLEGNKEIKVADVVKATGFSRAYINRFFQGLRKEGKIALIGRANKARYVLVRGKTVISLYKIGTDFIPRSQARRIVSGLEKFKKIILDFKDVDTVGQAFADEVFRVWKRSHSNINIEHQNANENIKFMIKRAKG